MVIEEGKNEEMPFPGNTIQIEILKKLDIR